MRAHVFLGAAALAFGGVGLVVNNAGLSISKPLAETAVADWDVLHDVMARARSRREPDHRR